MKKKPKFAFVYILVAILLFPISINYQVLAESNNFEGNKEVTIENNDSNEEIKVHKEKAKKQSDYRELLTPSVRIEVVRG